jgi:hypothetical protein
MGRKPVENKKLPSEYPQLAFRVSKEDKQRLTSLIEEVQNVLNNRRSEGVPFVNKNDVIVTALYEGLKSLRKRKAI